MKIIIRSVLKYHYLVIFHSNLNNLVSVSLFFIKCGTICLRGNTSCTQLRVLLGTPCGPKEHGGDPLKVSVLIEDLIMGKRKRAFNWKAREQGDTVVDRSVEKKV